MKIRTSLSKRQKEYLFAQKHYPKKLDYLTIERFIKRARKYKHKKGLISQDFLYIESEYTPIVRPDPIPSPNYSSDYTSTSSRGNSPDPDYLFTERHSYENPRIIVIDK